MVRFLLAVPALGTPASLWEQVLDTLSESRLVPDDLRVIGIKPVSANSAAALVKWHGLLAARSQAGERDLRRVRICLTPPPATS